MPKELFSFVLVVELETQPEEGSAEEEEGLEEEIVVAVEEVEEAMEDFLPDFEDVTSTSLASKSEKETRSFFFGVFASSSP